MLNNLIFAGPCSAETEEQVFQTASGLSDVGVKYFRAGLWKPRTSPNSFQGVGQSGLAWLKRVQKELNMFVGTEVANKEHIAATFEAKIDFLWIGARTTTNPFAVQEIADTIKEFGVDTMVLVKNPVIPDLALWLGAVERLEKAGVRRVVAVHRGFNIENLCYRNSPQWHIPIEFKRQKPMIDMLCDPSHIAGDSNLVEKIALQASKLNFNGLMVEVHNSPKSALSDVNQQITIEQFKNILDRIRQYPTAFDDSLLSLFRSKIDELDMALIDIIAKRMEISTQIGKFKKENNISVFMPDRYEQIIENYMRYAKKRNISPDFIKHLIEIIHQESINKQF